jgi:hypothetical protein
LPLGLEGGGEEREEGHDLDASASDQADDLVAIRDWIADQVAL